MRMLVLAIAGVLLPAEPAETQSVRTPKFSIVFSGGVRPAGPWGQDIAAGMRRANLDGDPCGDNAEIFCSFETRPVVDEDVLSYSIELGFRPTPALELALAYGSESAGTVSGYFDGGNTGTGDSDAELLVAMHAKTDRQWPIPDRPACADRRRAIAAHPGNIGHHWLGFRSRRAQRPEHDRAAGLRHRSRGRVAAAFAALRRSRRAVQLGSCNLLWSLRRREPTGTAANDDALYARFLCPFRRRNRGGPEVLGDGSRLVRARRSRRS
jgi:hypothetical protein